MTETVFEAKKREPIDIHFGDRTFTIKPTTLGQLLLLEQALSGGGKTATALARGVIEAALSRDYADVDVGELEMTMPEVHAAMFQVLKLAGFPTSPARVKDVAQAEAA